MSFRTTANGRSICWPEPDSVCLQGGCIYCPEYRVRSWNTIRRYAESKGMLKDFQYGEAMK